MNDDFYIGYLPNAPSSTGRFIRRVVSGVVGAVAATALVVALAQSPFAESQFEYGSARVFSGVLALEPYPRLMTNSGAEWLAGQGKRGAVVPAEFEGRRVELRGTRIERSGERMIELETGSIRTNGTASASVAEDLGDIVLRGEIVDAKCHLGVMNPGQGKVHRDCAARCLLGGLPPGLFVKGRRMYWLSGVTKNAVARWAGEQVEVKGRLRLVAESQVIDVRSMELL